MATRSPNQYDVQREKLATYFDSTARQAWIDLTSDVKVSGIRATVRAGRDAMRKTLLDWLPNDLRRTRVLDAGCGTGSFSIEAACRGAEVTAIDVAAGLVEVARQRTPSFIGHGRIDWRSGDMLDPALGTFAHVVAMDSLIHYQPADLANALAQLAERTTGSILFTFAPRTALLQTMYTIGKAFPRSDRSPAIVPTLEWEIRHRLKALPGWRVGRTKRISSGFYTSQALELVRVG